jgi:hypothetical protein
MREISCVAEDLLASQEGLCSVELLVRFSDTVQGGSNMTGTSAAWLHTNQSRSYLNHLVLNAV